VNPTTGEEIKLSSNLNFSRDELRGACANEEDYSAELYKAFHAMMAIGYPVLLRTGAADCP
jgi:hypothetical protein